LEELTMSQIIAKLRTAVMAFGMHGSLLILCMFLPPGAVLIEGYPYGVPAENYTPYRTMSRLSGVELTYRAWAASDPKASIGHPERGPRQGGLKHLNATYRDFILNSTTIPEHFCCDNPHWLYRIFQDTTVDPQQVTSLFWDGLKESLAMLKDK
jgi:protein O-mannose beta-1,4-N-acetylglucosaminyltransferase